MHSSPTKEIILVPRWSKCTFSHPLKDEKDVTDLPLEVKCTCIVCLDTSKYEKKTIALSSSISSHRGPEQRRRTVSRNAYNVRSNKTGKPRLFLPFNADLESWPHVTAQTIYRNHPLCSAKPEMAGSHRPNILEGTEFTIIATGTRKWTLWIKGSLMGGTLCFLTVLRSP